MQASITVLTINNIYARTTKTFKFEETHIVNIVTNIAEFFNRENWNVCQLRSARRLEELQFKSTVDHTPDASNWKSQTKGNPQPAQDPIEIPIKAVLCGLFYENPHEARVSECDWKGQSSQ